MGNITDYALTTALAETDKFFVNCGGKLMQITRAQLMSTIKFPRYKDITSYWTDGTLWNRIAGTNGYLPYEDIYPGDYINMGRTVTCPNIQGDTYNTVGSQYVTVASLGGLYYNGSSTALNYNHLIMIPGKGKDGSFHFGRHRMNPTSTTEGGYVGSEMNTAILGDIATEGSVDDGATINQQLYYIFDSHLKTTEEMLTNSINKTGYNRFGGNSGCSNNWAWTKVQAVLMSEIEVYGSTAWSSSGYDTGNAKRQFELFAQDERAINNRSSYCWLKDVASAWSFACADGSGNTGNSSASNPVHYVRPRFILA